MSLAILPCYTCTLHSKEEKKGEFFLKFEILYFCQSLKDEGGECYQLVGAHFGASMPLRSQPVTSLWKKLRGGEGRGGGDVEK